MRNVGVNIKYWQNGTPNATNVYQKNQLDAYFRSHEAGAIWIEKVEDAQNHARYDDVNGAGWTWEDLLAEFDE